jgi:hypothetical protein
MYSVMCWIKSLQLPFACAHCCWWWTVVVVPLFIYMGTVQWPIRSGVILNMGSPGTQWQIVLQYRMLCGSVSQFHFRAIFANQPDFIILPHSKILCNYKSQIDPPLPLWSKGRQKLVWFWIYLAISKIANISIHIAPCKGHTSSSASSIA